MIDDTAKRQAMLAVIIPTLDAQDCLPPLLAEVKHLRLVVSDGGSADDTLSLALSQGAVIALGSSGRGVQLARGADLAEAGADIDAFLFLHADSRLQTGWERAVEAALKTPDKAWYFGFRPRAKGLGAMWLRFIVWLRCWAWKLPYGDQGLLIPREMYDALGGFDREKPLFEDVDMVDRIKVQFGRQAIRALPIGLETDVSCYLREGIWTRGWRNYRLLRAYRRGTPIDELMRRYSS